MQAPLNCEQSMMAHRSGELAYVVGGQARTFRRVAEDQLVALSDALGWRREVPRLLGVQNLMLDDWGDWAVPSQPIYPSLVGDDHSPYEYSLAFEPGFVELRLLIEAQAAAPQLAANLTAAERLNGELAKQYPIDLSRYHQVRDLFVRPDSDAAFLLWHGACLTPGEPPDFKIYLNPAVEGPSEALRIVAEALHRLGFSSAAVRAIARFAFRGALDECPYFSLDLTGGAEARVKVYFAHRHANAADIERSFGTVATHQSDDARGFCLEMLGNEGPYDGKPVTSCLSFVAGNDAPVAVTLHAPVAHYVEDDATIATRVSGFLSRHSLPRDAYEAALGALATRPLSRGAGLHSYASYRRLRDSMRATVYLSPQLFENDSSHSGVQSRSRA